MKTRQIPADEFSLATNSVPDYALKIGSGPGRIWTTSCSPCRLTITWSTAGLACHQMKCADVNLSRRTTQCRNGATLPCWGACTKIYETIMGKVYQFGDDE
ncbi:hypothetical protein V3C99_017230 [Haemonchus contortus]